jgi:hypothetical protein
MPHVVPSPTKGKALRGQTGGPVREAAEDKTKAIGQRGGLVCPALVILIGDPIPVVYRLFGVWLIFH